MKPEHEQFLLDHVNQFGFMFIIDRLKDQYPELRHNEACDIYNEFKTKHAKDKAVQQADSAMKEISGKLGDAITDVVRNL